MYEFLDRLINIALPRVRDFRGLNPKSFDGRGNYAMGIKGAHRVPQKSTSTRRSVLGMDIIVCTTAKTDEDPRAAARVQFHSRELKQTRKPEGVRNIWPRKSAVEPR